MKGIIKRIVEHNIFIVMSNDSRIIFRFKIDKYYVCIRRYYVVFENQNFQRHRWFKFVLKYVTTREGPLIVA